MQIWLLGAELDVDGRLVYLIKTSLENFESVWDAVLQVVIDRALIAEVDGYPDSSWESYSTLAPKVREAHEQLVAIAEGRPDTARNSKMNVHLNLKNQTHVDITRVYGPHSISVDLIDEWGTVIAALKDGGSGGTATLSLAEVDRLRAELSSRSVSETVVFGPYKRGHRGRLEPA